MTAHLRRRRRLLLLGPFVAVWLGLIGAAPAAAASGYTRDLYFAGSWERQIDDRTCTAASTATMMNLLARRDLNLPQMAILRYEQPRDALNNRLQRGSDPLGWARAATYFSRYTPRPTSYHWEAYPTKALALARAARQIAATGKPVGLVVQHGQHAVVMTGVKATANPVGGAFTITSVAVSDPYGSAHTWYTVGGTPLGTYLETDANAIYDSLWVGKYVVIVPQA